MKRDAVPTVELLCVGTELLRGQVNTHQAHIAQRLQEAGLALSRASSLPDEVDAIAEEIELALSRCDAVLLCGGLGPTFDDLTREAAGKALGRGLSFKPALYAEIRKKFLRYKAPIPEENKRQAFVLDGAEVLANPHGSAPGQFLKVERAGSAKSLAMVPGPYSEMAPMLEREVLPRLKRLHAHKVFARRLSVHLSGVPESVADERLAPISAGHQAALEFTILSSAGQVDYHATARAATERDAEAAIAEVRRRVYDAVGEHVFGEGEDTIESVVGRELKRRKRTLAAAESCTGGLLGARVTAAPGSSDYFNGGVVAYSNELKERLLGVPAEVLRRHGAVSAECAAAMAEGARRACRADVGVSITGVAGPGGGTKQKPVGLVYLGVAGLTRAPFTRELRLIGGREAVRARSAATALHELHRLLKGA